MSDAFVFDRETDERPWGSYVVLDEAVDHKVKRIVVLPHRRLSLQVHRHRSEHWFVVEGTGLVTLGDTQVRLGAGDSVDIPVGMAHRMANTGDVDLVFIEVQHGESFGENDIVRLEDDFGRVER
ncbi:MAG TPA: phosphomannose isomerase type II C-terminal cupin domain [Acidimicrobiales bacterium]|nr:phosphomannose isomerase type II C-terminal cupin domain [Acidimicrobiales bacterium]